MLGINVIGGNMDDLPLFEMCDKAGNTWTVYEDGRTTGFPDGTVIVNRAIPAFNLLRGRIKQLQTPLVADN